MVATCALENLSPVASDGAQIVVRFLEDARMGIVVDVADPETDPDPNRNSAEVEAEILTN
jgi:hypothetical protein